MDVKELEKMEIGINDEIELTISVYGHKINISGIVLYIDKIKIRIREKESENDVYIKDVDKIEKINNQENKHNDDCGYKQAAISYSDKFDYDFVEMFHNRKVRFNDNYIRHITKIYFKILFVNFPDKPENKIVKATSEFIKKSKIELTFKQIIDFVKKETLKLDIKNRLEVFNFCSNIFYVSCFKLVDDESSEFKEAKEFLSSFGIDCVVDLDPAKDLSFSDKPSTDAKVNSVKFDKLIKRIDRIFLYLLQNLCEELIANQMRNFEQIKYVCLEYFGDFEIICYARKQLLKYLMINFKYSPNSVILELFKNAKNIKNDLFIRNIAVFFLINKWLYKKNEIENGSNIIENFDLNNRRLCSIVETSVHLDKVFVLGVPVYLNSLFRGSILILFQGCFLFKNYDGKILLIDKINDFNVKLLRDSVIEIFKKDFNNDSDIVFNVSSIEDIYNSYKESFEDILECLTRILYVNLKNINYIWEHAKLLNKILRSEIVSVILLPGLIRRNLLEFSEILLRIFDVEQSVLFDLREKALSNFSLSFVDSISGDYGYIGRLVRTLFKFSDNFDNTETFIRNFYYLSFPKLRFLINREAISFSDSECAIYIPATIANIGDVVCCQNLNIQAIDICLRVKDKEFLFKVSDKSSTSVMFSIPPRGAFNFLIRINDIRESFVADDVEIVSKIKYLVRYNYNSALNRSDEQSIVVRKTLNGKLVAFNIVPRIINNFFKYKSGSVIENEQMFFGRSELINAIINSVENTDGIIQSNRCICIYGQTRTGKSTLLFHLKKKLMLNSDNIIIDIGDLGAIDVSDASFRFLILQELSDEITYEHSKLKTVLSDQGFIIEPDLELLIKSPVLYFDTYLKRLNRLLYRFFPNARIVILIDEFTYIYDWIKIGKVSEDFMKFWKALIQNYHISAFIVGQDHMMKFINDPRFTNSFGSVTTFEVNYLKSEYARQLVTQPVSRDWCGDCYCDFSCEAVDYLVDITSGSPFLLMNICSDFIDFMNEIHARYATISHVEEFMRRHLPSIEERLFEPLFNDKMNLDSEDSIKENKKILAKIAHATSDNDSVKLDDLGISDSERSRIDHLTSRHVLKKDDGGYRILVKLYAMWLRRMTEKEDA